MNDRGHYRFVVLFYMGKVGNNFVPPLKVNFQWHADIKKIKIGNVQIQLKLKENYNRAKLVLVVQSKDNKFFNLNLNENIKTIPKNRISLSKRTTIQLLIQSKENINFKDNDDLNSFYGSIKDQINIPKHSIL